MNGAGTGLEAFRLRLGLLVRHRSMTGFGEVVLGVTLPSTARLLAVAAAARATVARTMASAWFAPRSSTLVDAVESRAQASQVRSTTAVAVTD